MDAFEKKLTERLPLAVAVLETFHFAFDDTLLNSLWDAHRGRCYTDVLEFPEFVRLVRDALLEHDGSGNRVCVEAQRDGDLPVDESNFYRKLSHMPVQLSRALLRECTVHLTELIGPNESLLPGCFEEFEVTVLDGKKLKNAAKRLKPTRGYSGSLLGAKGLVALSLRTGLALAMSDSLDGETNDVPLLPELLPQVLAVVSRPILWVADRQFADYQTPRLLQKREGDHFAIRIRRGLTFRADPTVPALQTTDEHGRQVIDEVGSFGGARNTYRVRRVTLLRETGQEDVVIITDLLDRKRFTALDLLKLYRRRWGIETVFQQVTETFGLEHLIGCQPQAVLFQLAFCLLVYNVIQVLKVYVAEDGKVDRSVVSMANLFYDVKRELQTWSYLALPAPSARAEDARAMSVRLRQLLRGSWDAIAYLKKKERMPRKYKPKKKCTLKGGHTSVQRLLDGSVTIPQNKYVHS